MSGDEVDRAYQLGEAKVLLALLSEDVALRIREDEILGIEVDPYLLRRSAYVETWLAENATDTIRGLAAEVAGVGRSATSPENEVSRPT